MYKNRVKADVSQESSFYLVTNRITGGSFIFGDVEKAHFKKLLVEGQRRHAYVLWDYVILDNHWHAVIEIPAVPSMGRDMVLQRWQLTQRLKKPRDPGDALLDEYNRKIHDLSFVVGNLEQRFTQWYNERTGRWGKLFGGRFDSVLLDEKYTIAAAMAYITLNPVRARIVADPAHYHWCGYAQRVAGVKLQPCEIKLAKLMAWELGLPGRVLKSSESECMRICWDRFRHFLLGQSPGHRQVDVATVRDLILGEGGVETLEWPQRLMLRTAFATKGIAIGSQEFVEKVLETSGKVLGYKRRHLPNETKVWDKIYSLKKHRRVIFC